MESEIRRLRLELKQTMEMYSAACKEALIAQKKVPCTNASAFSITPDSVADMFTSGNGSATLET